MSYLITQMLLCLLLAALLGFLIGWALRAIMCQRKVAELEEQLAAAVAAAGSGQRDDLKKIEGIGPKIQKLLNDDQIFTFTELAEAPVNRLKDLLRRAGDRYRMHDPTSWPDQAKLAAEGRWKELDEFQDILLGGRET